MKINKLAAAVIILLVSGGLFAMFGNAQQNSTFNSAQKEEINALIREYILQNPEIIPEAVEVLRSRQQASALSRSEDLLYDDGYSFTVGNEDADVTIVEFYDYNCGFCKQVPELFTRLLDEDKNVKIIYKELPILAESSEFASVAAMASMKQGKFLDFHNALMQNKRQLTEDLVLKIAIEAGIDKDRLIEDMADPEIADNIMQTKYLVRNIGIEGTPGFVIGDQLIAGYIPYEKLKEYIAKARES